MRTVRLLVGKVRAAWLRRRTPLCWWCFERIPSLPPDAPDEKRYCDERCRIAFFAQSDDPIM